MKLKVLFIHRTENYEGQHAPEAVAIIDEFEYDANPDWIHDTEKEHKEQSDISAVVIVNIEVSQEEIMKLLYPENEIKGEIVSDDNV